MKYIAVFNIPDDYGIGCATAMVAQKGKDRYEDDDYEKTYAEVEPLSEEKAEIFEKFNAVDRIMQDLGLGCAYDMPSFWYNKGKDYKVIPTKYHQGYMQALNDMEQEIRKRFGFAEREYIPLPSPFFDPQAESEEA